MYTMPPPIAATAIMGWFPRVARRTASTDHAAASSSEPAASASVPSGVPVSPRSWTIRASMGKAVIDIAAPSTGTPAPA